jgi:hypothetical protein
MQTDYTYNNRDLNPELSLNNIHLQELRGSILTATPPLCQLYFTMDNNSFGRQ